MGPKSGSQAMGPKVAHKMRPNGSTITTTEGTKPRTEARAHRDGFKTGYKPNTISKAHIGLEKNNNPAHRSGQQSTE